jgi:Pyruvate:ferredoxin oxidoreductase and related 2-oxoacid:ferredoxin oxidoreductases, gamma subunit
VHGGGLRRHKPKPGDASFALLPEPVLPGLAEPYGILITGVGGTGVVTIGALLGMAAHIEGGAARSST